jgi:SSS family solute:Na+ symporter
MNEHLAGCRLRSIYYSYFIVVSTYGYTIYRKREKNEHDAKAYFLGNPNMVGLLSVPIASNISAEQFAGMSGEVFL